MADINMSGPSEKIDQKIKEAQNNLREMHKNHQNLLGKNE
jgi:cellobiose-specific phosphotransferase system component IIA